MKFKDDIDLGGAQLLRARAESVAAVPASLGPGHLFFDTVAGRLKWMSGAGVAIDPLAAAGGPPGYSTTEQLLGRNWIDGKPIYIRSFQGTTPGAGTIQGTLFTVAGASEFVGWDEGSWLEERAGTPGAGRRIHPQAWYSTNPSQGPAIFFDTADKGVKYYYDGSDLRWSAMSYVLTVRYTKP